MSAAAKVKTSSKEKATTSKAPASYKKLSKGQANKTESAKKTATKYFDAFLATKLLPSFNVSLQRKEAFLLDKGLYQEFGTYLVEVAVDVSKKPLTVDNAKGVFGNIVTTAQGVFPAHHTFHGGLDNWYSNTRSAIHTKIYTRLIDKGESVDNKNEKPLAIELMTQMVEALWRKGDVVSMGKASMIISSYNAIGRGGEVAFSNVRKWSHCLQYNTLDTEWSERKTLEGDHMGLFAHCFLPEMCVLYHLSGWVMMGGPVVSQIHDEPGWVYPTLARNPVTAADRMSDNMREAIKEIPEYAHRASEFSSTMLRCSSAQHVFDCPALRFNPLPAAARGGWEMKALGGNLFVYVHQLLGCSNIAGKILAGVLDPFRCHHQPKLVFCDDRAADELVQVVEKMIVMLYTEVVPEIAPGHRLWQVGKLFFAVELMWFSDFVMKYKKGLRIEKLVEVGGRAGLGTSRAAVINKISEWGHQVKTQFRLANELEKVAGNHQPTEVLIDNMVRLQAQNDLMKVELSELRQVNSVVFLRASGRAIFPFSPFSIFSAPSLL